MAFGLLAIIFGTLLFASFAMTSALAGYSRSRLEKLCEQYSKESRFTEILEHDESTHLAVRAWSWFFLAAFLSSLFSGMALAPTTWWLTVEIALVAWICAILVELWIARPIGLVYADRLVYFCWPLLVMMRNVMLPVLYVSSAIRRLLLVFSGQPIEGPPIEEELRDVIEEGEREGSIKSEAADIIERSIGFHQLTVDDVMTPRTQLIMVSADADVVNAAKLIDESGHSRLPVYDVTKSEKESKDRGPKILGIIHAKDILPLLISESDRSKPISSLELHEPLMVPVNQPLVDLLTEFKRRYAHVAIAVDEFGTIAGMVTIEDILEEIVGEIEDEYDDPTDNYRVIRIENKGVEIDGRVPVQIFNEEFGNLVPESEHYDTLAGYVLDHMGNVAKPGESFDTPTGKFTVVSTSKRQIRRVRVDFTLKSTAESDNGRN